jgi:hypothetical protein
VTTLYIGNLAAANRGWRDTVRAAGVLNTEAAAGDVAGLCAAVLVP